MGGYKNRARRRSAVRNDDSDAAAQRLLSIVDDDVTMNLLVSSKVAADLLSVADAFDNMTEEATPRSRQQITAALDKVDATLDEVQDLFAQSPTTLGMNRFDPSNR